MKKIYFGEKYNQNIMLPSTLTHIFFNGDFNQKIIIPESVLYLGLSDKFDCLINIPSSVKFLCIKNNNNNIVDYLTDNLETLVIQSYDNFNAELNNLPNSIETLIVDISKD